MCTTTILVIDPQFERDLDKMISADLEDWQIEKELLCEIPKAANE